MALNVQVPCFSTTSIVLFPTSVGSLEMLLCTYVANLPVHFRFRGGAGGITLVLLVYYRFEGLPFFFAYEDIFRVRARI